MDLHRPRRAPIQIRLSILPVGIFPISNAKVVGRRCDDKIDLSIWQARHAFDTILETQIKLGHRRKVAEQIRFVQRIRYCLGNVGQAFQAEDRGS